MFDTAVTLQVHDKFVLALTMQINRRFPDVDILDAFGMFNPRAVPDLPLCDLDDYGKEQIQVSIFYKVN